MRLLKIILLVLLGFFSGYLLFSDKPQFFGFGKTEKLLIDYSKEHKDPEIVDEVDPNEPNNYSNDDRESLDSLLDKLKKD